MILLIEFCWRVWHARQKNKTKLLSEIAYQILLDIVFREIARFLFPGLSIALSIAFKSLCWIDKLNQKKKITAKERFLLTLDILGTIIGIAESCLDIDFSCIPDILDIAIVILA